MMTFKSLFFFCISLLAVCPARAADRDYGKIPLNFEANLGQADQRVKFLSRGPGFGFFLTNEEAILQLVEPEPATVRMKLVGQSERPTITGIDQLSGKSHYLKGNNPAAWRRDIPSYARVRYADVYPGVDLVYYGNQRQLEYDFVIAPGSTPDQIQLRFDGIRGLEIDGDGQLVKFGHITVDFRSTEVFRDGQPVELSAREFKLLRYFLEHRGLTVSRDELLNAVWGYDAMPLTRTVDVHVAWLRQKLEPHPRHPQFILTVHGLGYRFAADRG